MFSVIHNTSIGRLFTTLYYIKLVHTSLKIDSIIFFLLFLSKKSISSASQFHMRSLISFESDLFKSVFSFTSKWITLIQITSKGKRLIQSREC